MNKEEIAKIINKNKTKIIINLKKGYNLSIVYDIESVCLNGNCIQLNVNELFDESENNEEIDQCICDYDDNNINCKWCY